MRLSSLYTWPELADTAVLGISWSEMRLSSLYYWPELADTAVLGISWSDTWLSSLYLVCAGRHIGISWSEMRLSSLYLAWAGRHSCSAPWLRKMSWNILCWPARAGTALMGATWVIKADCYGCVHCTKTNLNFCIKTELVTRRRTGILVCVSGPDKCRQKMDIYASAITGLVFMQRFRLFLVYCGADLKKVFRKTSY